MGLGASRYRRPTDYGPPGGVNTLPREAREGLMRAWLKVLSDRHPNVTWVPVSHNNLVTDSDAEPVQMAWREQLAQSA